MEIVLVDNKIGYFESYSNDFKLHIFI